MRQHRSDTAGTTIFELPGCILATLLAYLLATWLGSFVPGAWHSVVWWAVMVPATVFLSIPCMIGFGYLYGYFDHRRTRRPPQADTPKA